MWCSPLNGQWHGEDRNPGIHVGEDVHSNKIEVKSSVTQCWASTPPTQLPYGCTKGLLFTIENVSIVSPLIVLKYASALFGSPPALKVINSAP
jgi:hypothetical protein